MAEAPLRLLFEGGTILIRGALAERLIAVPGCKFDPRSGGFRAEARWYRSIVEHLRHQRIAYIDEVRAYQPAAWPIKAGKEPFPHQTEALEAWWRQQGRGVVVLPTGTGKTYLAVLAINRASRPALVLTPTIDLLNQWHDELIAAFETPVGLL